MTIFTVIWYTGEVLPNCRVHIGCSHKQWLQAIRTYSAKLKFCVISLSQTWYKDDRVRFVPVSSLQYFGASCICVISCLVCTWIYYHRIFQRCKIVVCKYHFFSWHLKKYCRQLRWPPISLSLQNSNAKFLVEVIHTRSYAG